MTLHGALVKVTGYPECLGECLTHRQRDHRIPVYPSGSCLGSGSGLWPWEHWAGTHSLGAGHWWGEATLDCIFPKSVEIIVHLNCQRQCVFVGGGGS